MGEVAVVEQAQASPLPQIGPVVVDLRDGVVVGIRGKGIGDPHHLIDVLLMAIRVVNMDMLRKAQPESAILLAHAVPKVQHG